jgi:hypothetical protein
MGDLLYARRRSRPPVLSPRLSDKLRRHLTCILVADRTPADSYQLDNSDRAGFVVLALNQLNPPTLRPIILSLSALLALCLSTDALRLNVPAFEK